MLRMFSRAEVDFVAASEGYTVWLSLYIPNYHNDYIINGEVYSY